jgi:hypothetical protein
LKLKVGDGATVKKIAKIGFGGLKGLASKGAGLVGVNLMSGNPLNQIMFKNKDPDYEVDESAGRLFNLNKDCFRLTTLRKP